MSATGDFERHVMVPANDNASGDGPTLPDGSLTLSEPSQTVRKPPKRVPRHKFLGVDVHIAPDLPVQAVEIEVLAELLDSLGPAANDNEEPS